MKKFKVLFLALITLFVFNISVNAKDVSTYLDLKTCLENDTDATCKLTQNVEPLDSDIKTITVKGTKTLDLNSYTLTMLDSLYVDSLAKLTVGGNGTISSSKIDKLIYVKAGGNLSVDDVVLNATKYSSRAVYIKGASDNTTKTNVVIGKNAKLFGNYALMIAFSDLDTTLSNGITVDVYGTINAIVDNDGWQYGGIGIYINGNITSNTTNPSVVNIYDGAKIIGVSSPAIYAGGYANWNILKATLEGAEALSIKAGKFIVDGATLSAVGDYIAPDNVVRNDNGNEPTGAAISITSNSKYDGNIELTLKNVNVSSKYGYALFDKITLGDETQVKKISIESGVFEGKVGDIYNGSKFTKFIKKGTFSEKLDATFINDAHSMVEIEDKFYVGADRFIEIEPIDGGEVTVSKTKAIEKETVKIDLEIEDGYYLKNIKVINARDKEEYIELGTNLSFEMPDYDILIEVELAEYLKKEENFVEVEAELEIDDEIESELKDEIEEIVVDSSLLDAIDMEKLDVAETDVVEVKIVSTLDDIKEVDGKVSLVFDIKPVYSINGDEIGVLENKYLNGEKIKIKLPVPKSIEDTHAKITHKSEDKVISELEVEVITEDGNKYVEIEPTSFSEFIVDFYTPEVSNPETYDSITMNIIVLLVAFGVLITAVLIIKKRNN